ncbi:TPA: N-acetylmuramoyl-L-alanine amidase [Streptococcus suis]|nr:N-acetylmuramoyl-L-alanine amidase [Streptococcus suis]
MSNLDLKLVQMLVPSAKYGIKCPYAMVPEFLTIHNTANNASALAEISYMIGNWNEVSYHWAVDDVQAIQAFQHNRNGWHCGDGTNGTGNRKSIGIEICYSLTPGHPKYAKAEDNGAKLAAIILHQLGWGIDRICKHQDWSGKYCPHRILDNGNWEGFKGKVQGYLLQLQGKQTPKPKATTTVASKPKPKPKPKPATVREYTEYGTFTATENIYFRNEPNLNGRTQGMYYKGESVKYDRVRVDYNGFVWISWISASTGIRRWMPIKVRKNGKTTEVWGNVK